MSVSAAQVKELRDRTLAGFADCKKALAECDGDMEKAAEFLRKKGLVTAAKKAGRTAAAGLVHSYIHAGGKIGVLVEVNCETDFVAKTDAFTTFVTDLGMQIAAMNPRWLTPEEVPAEEIAKEREIRTAQAKESGKPDNVLEKIVDGQIKKWYAEVCLLEQPFVKENKKTISQLVTELVAAVGENCKVRRFVRWEVGEGIEVIKKDYAEEVAELAAGGAS
ncbi:MAG: translation elongation factor Ts [Deltaproteobacteria bacterium]|nr:translation elongation factor Ts [Deltaproteobacteria bacterium]